MRGSLSLPRCRVCGQHGARACAAASHATHALWLTCSGLPPLSSLAGYKEKARSGTTYDRAEIEECNLGEVSYWGGGVRTPTTPENCEPCADNNKYAPRKGALN